MCWMIFIIFYTIYLCGSYLLLLKDVLFKIQRFLKILSHKSTLRVGSYLLFKALLIV